MTVASRRSSSQVSKGAHLAACGNGVGDADLGGVEVDQPPFDRAGEDLAQRLGCFEAMAGRDLHPPGGDLT
jgi:hypothetical protein